MDHALRGPEVDDGADAVRRRHRSRDGPVTGVVTGVRRHGLDVDRGLVREATSPRVVDDHDAAARVRRSEQLGLGTEVLLHAAVEVEVVPLQVREARDVEHEPVDPPECKGMGRDLHRHGRHPELARPRERRVQRGRLHRGPHAPGGPVAEAGLDGAEQSGRSMRRTEGGIDEVGRGGLAVRPGDPDGDQTRPRRVVHRCRDRPREGTRIGRHENGQTGASPRTRRDLGDAGRVREHRDSAGRDGVVDERRPVHALPGHGDEEIARLHVTAVHRRAPDLDGRPPRDRVIRAVLRRRKSDLEKVERRDYIRQPVRRGGRRTQPYLR
ncbi:hypothetical protein GALL_442220 [mine drainage metagenome]|uniref:Uncharacterized protein n=1 Tax=mine drainage metagenome TaxID=410659 RepID=A0A1J5Q2N6_9ZZZZ